MSMCPWMICERLHDWKKHFADLLTVGHDYDHTSVFYFFLGGGLHSH